MALRPQHRRGRRRGQRGVAAMELALGLPILLLIAAGAFAMGRIGMTKIRLEGWTNQAAHTCALDREVETTAAAQVCIEEFLERAPLQACGESLTPTVTFEDFETAYVDPATGADRIQIVPTLKARITCDVTPIRGAGFITKTALSATAVASRN